MDSLSLLLFLVGVSGLSDPLNLLLFLVGVAGLPSFMDSLSLLLFLVGVSGLSDPLVRRPLFKGVSAFLELVMSPLDPFCSSRASLRRATRVGLVPFVSRPKLTNLVFNSATLNFIRSSSDVILSLFRSESSCIR